MCRSYAAQTISYIIILTKFRHSVAVKLHSSDILVEINQPNKQELRSCDTL